MISNDAIYNNSYEWTYEVYLSQSLWLRRALVSLVVLSFLLTLSLLANLFLLPLKEKIPYLYAFDHATGEVTKIGKLESTALSENWELSRYLLMQYVINREGYHYTNLNLPYQFVWAQSDGSVQKEYEEAAKSSNPLSPYQLFGKEKYVTVHVTSINRLNGNTVDIKFEKTLHDQASGIEKTIPKEAIVKWTFLNTKIDERTLERDPLGFKVTYYQVSQVNLDK